MTGEIRPLKDSLGDIDRATLEKNQTELDQRFNDLISSRDYLKVFNDFIAG